jgi:hypothetical protein
MSWWHFGIHLEISEKTSEKMNTSLLMLWMRILSLLFVSILMSYVSLFTKWCLSIPPSARLAWTSFLILPLLGFLFFTTMLWCLVSFLYNSSSLHSFHPYIFHFSFSLFIHLFIYLFIYLFISFFFFFFFLLYYSFFSKINNLFFDY